MLALLARRRRRKEAAQRLYLAVVERAREPALYLEGGVADTPEGRLELVAAHLVVLVERLGRAGEAGRGLAQGVVEAFVADMDTAVREMGIGDTGVAKRVKKAAAALYDRHRAYVPALLAVDEDELASAIAREAGAGIGSRADPAFLARGLIAEAARLATVTDSDLLPVDRPRDEA
jgi:cytochrome b pre-mRNA-processing protein 3